MHNSVDAMKRLPLHCCAKRLPAPSCVNRLLVPTCVKQLPAPSGFAWLPAAACCLLLHAAACCCLLLPAATCCCLLLLCSCCCLLLFPRPPPVVLWSVDTVAVVAAVCFLVLVLDSQRFGLVSYVLVSIGFLRTCFLLVFNSFSRKSDDFQRFNDFYLFSMSA